MAAYPFEPEQGLSAGKVKQKLFLSLALTVFLLGTLSCRPAVSSGRKSIVVTYSVLGSVVRELAGDLADVTVSVPDGLDPHEWQPSARDIETINKADLVVENGLGLEGGMQKTLEAARRNGVTFFTAADHITVRYVGAGEGILAGDPDWAVGAPDPHLWTDPLVMKDIVAGLADTLEKDFGMDVVASTGDLQDRLDALDGEVEDIVAPVPPEERKLVTGHESMGYFARRYGFKLVGVIVPSLSSQAAVSAANMAALKQAIQENHVGAIFAELGTSPAEARAIGDETGVKVVELDTHTLPADGSYFTFLKTLATEIADALK